MYYIFTHTHQARIHAHKLEITISDKAHNKINKTKIS